MSSLQLEKNFCLPFVGHMWNMHNKHIIQINVKKAYSESREKAVKLQSWNKEHRGSQHDESKVVARWWGRAGRKCRWGGKVDLFHRIQTQSHQTEPTQNFNMAWQKHFTNYPRSQQFARLSSRQNFLVSKFFLQDRVNVATWEFHK